ncbi:hypothetical protein GCM10007304_30150 [Rhodococcoides trifolii]|uniref:DUF2188 domain-containing protein n=1 Tax=Rhodococcoides trifolii TaxID=908250 RepID=A0A917FYB5_9NOCA|nr:DUF2188 domain-containing protein [Rhodococcus trifolii]GGG14041.1 hypothetical protein GCM10007304_30150 [Rhodococcus trifolii]
MAANSAHVVWVSSSSWWKVTLNGIARDHKPVKAEAIASGRRLLKSVGGGELVIHNMDGSIAEKDTIAPGNDPSRIPG